MAEVLEFTVLEQFIDEGKKVLGQIKSFMGNNTKQSCTKIEEYFIINE